MKKFLFLLVLIAITIISACSNDDDNNNPIDQLPPATQSGKQTFACLINGEAFIPSQFGQGRPRATYFFKDNAYTLGLSGATGGGTNSQLIVVQGLDVEALEEKQYQLVSQMNQAFSAIYDKGSSGQEGHINAITSETNPGTLIITKFDEERGIVAGTFEFTVLDKEGNEIKITDGRFDLFYESNVTVISD
ncbi:hypothetical protein F0000_26555 [Aquimarina sp. RZ0]|nr:hypothetical protein F0000_26555 [Aquimarina sp. RZ0]